MEGAFHADTVTTKWKSVTFQSFCRKYGDHATPKVGSHCWNEDIICSLHNALSDYCPAIERKVESLAGLNNEINQLFHEVEGEIESETNDPC